MRPHRGLIAVCPKHPTQPYADSPDLSHDYFERFEIGPFYGLAPWEGAHPDYSALTGAVLGHFAGKDESASPETARALVRTLRGAGNDDVNIHIYPEADHAFFNDTRPEVYDAGASALAWQRTTEFLRSRSEERRV